MPCATPWRPESAADGHPEQWDGRAAAEQPGHMRDSGPASEAAAIMEATNTPGAGGWHGALPRHNQYDQDADPRRHDFHPAGTDRRSWADGADLGARSYGHHGAAPVPDNAQHLQVPREPTHPLYREAQLIFDSIEYFNENVSGDLISIKSHFNPYRVDMTRIENIPRIYISMLVTVATSHRAMQEAADGQLAQSTSALVRLRQQDIFAFRIKAIQEVNQRLSLQETQTSDSTLMCVLCLLMCTIQQSTYSDWRLHLEGAREIIKLRGGLGRIASESHHFRPLFVIFVAIDVLSATTTSTKHPKMTEAVLMALHYWEAAPNMFQANLAISAPCPEELFQAIILVNYLRTIVRRPKMQTRRHAGTRMVLQKIQSFNIPQWAARMKNFKGWKRSGESVEFEDDTTPARTLSSSSESSSSRTSPADEHHTMSTADSESPMTTATSPRAQTPDLWLDVGVMYHCAVLLYALRTLLLDIDEDKSFLLSDSASASHWSSQDGLELEQEIEQLRQKTHSTLLDTMGPIFSDHEAAQEVGKLVFFPAFMCGMELCGFFPAADLEANMAKQTLVSNGLELVGQACGTMAPICAAEEVRTKWALEAEEGRMVRWDDFLATRPDFTFGF